MSGGDGEDGPKAFHISIEARDGKEAEVVQMLNDIRTAVEAEPGTGPWYSVRDPLASFAIFDVVPSPAATLTSRARAATSSATRRE